MSRPRFGSFHCLPPGGAFRWFVESTTRTADRIAWHVFSVDPGAASRWGRDPRSSLVREAAEHYEEFALPGAPLASRLGAIGKVMATEGSSRVQRRIASQIDALGLDLIVVHHDQYTSSPALLEYVQTPTVYYCQEPRRRSFEYWARSTRPEGWSSPMQRSYEWRLRRADLRRARAADRIMVNSVFSMENVSRAYGRDADVVPLGVDGDVFRGSGAERSDPPYVVAVGAIDQLKAQDLIVEALALLPASERPLLRLVFERIDPRYAERLEELARDRRVAVQWHRAIDDVELRDLYVGAVATVGTARLEPLGLTPIESLACGTPVIAIDEGGYRETVQHGVNGLLVPRSAESLSDAIVEVVGRRWDADELRATVMPERDWGRVADAFGDRLLDVAADMGSTEPGDRREVNG